MIRVAFGLLFLGLSFFLSSSTFAQTASPRDLAVCARSRYPVLCRCWLENGGELRYSPDGKSYDLYVPQDARGGSVNGYTVCASKAERQGAQFVKPQRPTRQPAARTRQGSTNTHPPAISLGDISRPGQGQTAAPTRVAAAPAAEPQQPGRPPQGQIIPTNQPGSVVIGPYRQLPRVIYVQYDRPGGVVYVPYVGNGR